MGTRGGKCVENFLRMFCELSGFVHAATWQSQPLCTTKPICHPEQHLIHHNSQRLFNTITFSVNRLISMIYVSSKGIYQQF